MGPKDRRTRLQDSTSFNGIDFVEVADDSQSRLRVHFLNALPLDHTLGRPPVTITGGESIPTVAVDAIDESTAWSLDGTHLVLDLTVGAPGDFSEYVLRLTQVSPVPAGRYRLDPFLDKASFSFKTRCPSNLDCQAAPAPCAPPAAAAPPIDYLAKDFLSFRQALLDFSALRYGEWQERSEADFGVMFLEALCALADDLSYTQDRVAAEAFLATATQRRSVVRLARLVDYWPRPAVAATVLLQFDVQRGVTSLADGLAVTGPGPDGTPIPFETGTGLLNRLVDPMNGALRPRGSGPSSTVSDAWNRGAIYPYWFDDSQRCLPVGATQMYLMGSGYGFSAGQPLLIETAPPTSADPPIRQIVRLLDAGQPGLDPLYDPPQLFPGPIPPGLRGPGSPPQGTAVTLIRWQPEDALLAARDLAHTILAGNLIFATQGRTQPLESFSIPDPRATQPPQAPPAIVRTGPNDTASTPSLQYLYPLRSGPMAWVQPADPTRPPQPEMVLYNQGAGGQRTVWQFLRWLLDAAPMDTVFTLDDARYTRITGGTGAPRYDYDGDAGTAIRFGDDSFGAVPQPGTTFYATYRVGGGAAGNVAADSITAIEPGDQAKYVVHVTNPLPAGGGADADPLDTIRRLAPEVFRAVPKRAVIPADYQAAAQGLSWVKRAGTVFRWTGSWPTVFTTPDPVSSERATADQRVNLIDLLDRYRMAGYESYITDPEYVSVDLLVRVCAQPSAFQGAVEQAALTALGSGAGGFFAHDSFTFGQSLEKSVLEAAVQAISGVAGVLDIRYRFSGRAAEFSPMGDTVAVGTNQILRCDNDPSVPANGSIQLVIEGGR